MRKILPLSFFRRDAQVVAEDLLLKYIVREVEGVERAYKITEVEAYDGPEDAASHAFRGKTKRNEIMFGLGGFLYVYFIYGMYYMINVVTGSKEYPSAILIRATEEVSGPGRLARALSVDTSLNGVPVTKAGGIWFEDRGLKPEKSQILRGPRINVSYAGPVWSQKPFRYVYINNVIKKPKK